MRHHIPNIIFGYFSFNPRICKRCDIRLLLMWFIVLSFNPRICKRCDDSPIPSFAIPYCFNPRICKRCDRIYVDKLRDYKVSIHASVKDATFATPNAVAFTTVSIHASVKDATLYSDEQREKLKVSIHASVKDATQHIKTTCKGRGFNPRICKRCDGITLFLLIGGLGFNPRICKRCDYKNQCNDNKSKVSIHASVKDATQRHNDGKKSIESFNPRICKRCDNILFIFASCIW